MIKISKQKLLATTVLLAVLLISSAYSSLMPSAHAQEVTTATAKALTITNQVAGLDLTKYNATQTVDAADSYMGVLPTENIGYTLTGNGSVIEIQDTFTNGSLQIMDVLENVGSPHITASAASLVNPISFLLNYQAYSRNSFYGQLASMLINADPAKNLTTIVGNIKFEITTTTGNTTWGNCTTFHWSYTSNGADAACKCVSLSYENGFLSSFIDTWNLYPIGSTTVNLSEQKAEDIAIRNAKACSWTIGSGSDTHVINNFNVTKPMVEQLLFSNAGNLSNVRSSDPLTLYPMWQIGVGLDKFYPGDVYGIYVDIWADTGQVRDTQQAISTLPAPAGDEATIAESSIPTVNNQTSTTAAGFNMFPAVWMALAAFAVFTMMAVPVWLSRKKTLVHSWHLQKLSKIGGLVLCVLIGSVALVALGSAVPTVNATNAYSNIWGDTSTGTNQPPHNSTELNDQGNISIDVNQWFSACGYTSNNYEQYGQTLENNVISNTNYDDMNSPSVATVYFDHGVGKYGEISLYPNEWHYMLCSDEAVLTPSTNYAGDIFDYQIYSATSTSNHQYTNNYFSYISTCESANLSAGAQLNPNWTGSYGSNPTSNGGSGYQIGMPYAWTHEYTTSSPTTNPPQGYMSLDGWSYPDNGAFCYIGFPYGSASLSQTLNPSNSATYYNFVYDFFYAALIKQYTVNNALNYATQGVYGIPYFNGTPLFQGFIAWWNDTPSGTSPDCTMTVYGNGNIYLYPSSGPDYVSTPTISDNVPTVGVTGTTYYFTASAKDPYPSNSLTYTFNWGDGTTPTQTSSPTNVPHAYSSDGIYTVTVKAQSSSGISRSSSTTVTIGNMLSVYAWDAYWAWRGYADPLYPNVYIDGINYGPAPVSIPVAPGTHAVGLDYSTWDPYWNQYATFYLMYDSNGNYYYGGGGYVPVTSPTGVAAFYYP